MTPAGETPTPTPTPTSAPAPAPRAALSPERIAAAERRLHLLVLAICLGLVGTAFVLTPASPAASIRAGGGAITLAGFRLPEVCAFKRVTGLPCPGCGLTRSWVAAVHGDLADSFAFHRLGWLVLLYVVVQALRHGAWLVVTGRREAIERAGGWLDRGIIPLGGLLLIAWVPTLLAALG